MKKYISIALSAFMALFCLTACDNNSSEPSSDNNAQSEKLQIVTTIFPEYDWVKQILGDNAANAEITMLLDNGIDLHSYQPTAEDIMKISTCDMFIYVGGESDQWVEDALKEATNKDKVVINLVDSLGDAVKEEEIVEGMEHDHDHEHEEEHEDEHEGEHEDEHEGEHEDEHEAEHEDEHEAEHEDEHEAEHEDEHEGEHEDEHEAEHEDEHEGEHEHEHEDEHEHDEEHHHETDEHVWLSLRNAKVLCGTILDALCKIDSANSDMYKQNADSYIAKLTELDTQYQETVNAASVKTLLFGDRFPFRYMVDDYGLDYYAAFAGCSAETEASFETVTFLSGKVDELNLSCVLTLEKSDQKIASTVIQNTQGKNQQILTLDSMQSTTSKDVASGATYLSIMESNLGVLKEALK